jgi:hypothetical protein
VFVTQPTCTKMIEIRAQRPTSTVVLATTIGRTTAVSHQTQKRRRVCISLASSGRLSIDCDQLVHNLDPPLPLLLTVQVLILPLHLFRKHQRRSRLAKHGLPVSSSVQSSALHSSAFSHGSAFARRSPRKLLPHYHQQHTTRSLQRQRVRPLHRNTTRRLCSSKALAWLLSASLMANKTHGPLNPSHPSAKRHLRIRLTCMATSILSRVDMRVQDSLCTTLRAQV